MCPKQHLISGLDCTELEIEDTKYYIIIEYIQTHTVVGETTVFTEAGEFGSVDRLKSLYQQNIQSYSY